MGRSFCCRTVASTPRSVTGFWRWRGWRGGGSGNGEDLGRCSRGWAHAASPRAHYGTPAGRRSRRRTRMNVFSPRKRALGGGRPGETQRLRSDPTRDNRTRSGRDQMVTSSFAPTTLSVHIVDDVLPLELPSETAARDSLGRLQQSCNNGKYPDSPSTQNSRVPCDSLGRARRPRPRCRGGGVPHSVER